MKYDEKGNLHDWWTKEDLKHYKKKTQAMIDQWDGLKALEALKTEKIQTIKNFLNHGQVFGVKKQPKNKVSPQFSQMFMHHMN